MTKGEHRTGPSTEPCGIQHVKVVGFCIANRNMLDSVCKVGLLPSRDNAIKASVVF